MRQPLFAIPRVPIFLESSCSTDPFYAAPHPICSQDACHAQKGLSDVVMEAGELLHKRLQEGRNRFVVTQIIQQELISVFWHSCAVGLRKIQLSGHAYQSLL
jgi:hypothetical protein